MSVISRNPFDLLGDDGDSSPAPVKTQPKTETPAAAPARTVPGSTPAGANNTNNANRGGRYPNRGGRGRGGATSGQQREDGPRNTAQVAGSGDIEGFETPGGFDGERVNPPKRAHHGPDRHTRTANDQPRILVVTLHPERVVEVDVVEVVPRLLPVVVKGGFTRGGVVVYQTVKRKLI